jgi:hypothetical protein
MKKSPLGKLNWRDALHSFLLAIAAAVITTLIQMYTKEPPQVDLTEIKNVAIITALSYIGKQLSQNSEGRLFKKDK